MENTHLFNHLKPAGTLLFLEDEETTFYDFMKATFADLVLKQVITLEAVTRKSHRRDSRPQTFVMVKSGPNYHFYRPSNYELTFIKEVPKDTSIIVKTYLENVYDESPRDRKFKKSLVVQLNLHDYFYTGFFFHLFRVVDYNVNGNDHSESMRSYLSSINHNLKTYILHDPEMALKHINLLKGSIFLLENLDYDLWKAVCELKNQESQTYHGLNLDNANLDYLSPEYYQPEIFPALNYTLSRFRALVGYHGVFSGVGDGDYDSIF